MFGHKCKVWEETGRVYQPSRVTKLENSGFKGPASAVEKMIAAQQRLMDEAMHGVTVVTYRCTECKILRTDRLIGKVTTE